MSDAVDTERDILGVLRDEYVSEGYSFYEYPDARLLPEPLKRFRPDAIALKGDEKIVIEVKRRVGNGSPSAAVLADAVYKTPGWKFRMVVADTISSDSVTPRTADLHSIEWEFKQATRLKESGFLKSAFISGWTTLEAIARRHAALSDESYPPRPLRPRSVVTRLNEAELITTEQAERLNDLIELRNRILHGDLQSEVSDAQLDAVMTAVSTAFGKLGEADRI